MGIETKQFRGVGVSFHDCMYSFIFVQRLVICLTKLACHTKRLGKKHLLIYEYFIIRNTSTDFCLTSASVVTVLSSKPFVSSCLSVDQELEIIKNVTHKSAVSQRLFPYFLSVNTYMHTYLNTCMHTYIYSYVRTHAHVCMLIINCLTIFYPCRHAVIFIFISYVSYIFPLRSRDKCVLQPYTDTYAISFWHITMKCSMPYVVWLGINAKFTWTTLPVTTHYQSFKYTLNVRFWTIKSSFMQNWFHYSVLTRSLFHPHRIYNINIP